MAGNSTITITGNVGKDDPTLRFTPQGKAVANFSVAVTPRVKRDGEWIDGTTTWYRISAWEWLAEAVAEHVRAGAPVVVVGSFTIDQYEKDGQARTAPTIRADVVGLIPRPAPKVEKPQETSEGDPW